MSKNNLVKKDGISTLSNKNKIEPQACDLRSTIELPRLEGDTQIYLGQTIVTLMRLSVENDICYSKEMQHCFKVEIMASVLEELNVSLDDIAEVYQERKIVEE